MPPKTKNKTVLIVGEGYDDTAFLYHLKGIYIQRGCGVKITIKNAKGKGSNNVVSTAVGAVSRMPYDIAGAFYDDDVALLAKWENAARAKRIHRIESTPCLEGLLLLIEGQHVPHSSDDCKKRIQPVLIGNNPTMPEAYANFTKAKLEAQRPNILELDRLIRLIQGA